MLLIEMQCKDWEHNRVNAGIIELSSMAFPGETLKLYAEEKHISSIEKLITLQHNQKKMESTPIDFDDWRLDNYKCIDKYTILLKNIVEKEPNENRVILLSSNKGIVCAVKNIAVDYPDKRFYIIMHSALEEVIFPPKLTTIQRMKLVVHDAVRKVNVAFRTKETNKEVALRECINNCISENTFFVLYAPEYRRYLKGKINENVLNKFIFLHHPLYENENSVIPNNEKLVIGIYGQAVNQNAFDVIKTYNDKYDNDKAIFRVMAKADANILELKNVVRMFDEDYVPNEALEEARKHLDYILIPYDNNQYKVTASGILCDALSEQIPILMLDSPLLRYYESIRNIGILCDNKDELAHNIACLAENRSMQKKNAEQNRQEEQELRHIILEENIKAFREKIR